MGRVSFQRLKSSLRLPAVGAVVAVAGLLLFFQNCGKAGMDSTTDDAASLTADTPDVKKYKAAPFPFDVNINQIAYMTCPMAGTSISLGEDVEAPFFTLRAGAYDNRILAARYPDFFPAAAAMSATEKNGRLNAGIGLSETFMTYMQTNFGTRIAAMTTDVQRQRLFHDAIVNSTHKYKMSSGLILNIRNSSGFAWSDKHAKGVLDTLTTSNMANQMAIRPDLGIFGTEKLHEVTGVASNQRSIVSSIGVTENEIQREQFRSNLVNYQFVMGYTKPELEGSVFSLASADDNLYSIYGKTYRFTLGRAWGARTDRYVDGTTVKEAYGLSSNFTELLQGVTEMDISVKNAPVDVTTRDGQQWDCFSLMIVRDVDRRDPATSKILDPGLHEDARPTGCTALWGGTNCDVKLKYYDYQASATTPIIPAVKTACPIQEIGDTSRFGSLNGNDKGLARMRLEIARRFLPAEYWDVNTSPEYMCAVPKSSASPFGQCYAAGDFDATKYILYLQKARETVNGTTSDIVCGRDPLTGKVQKECPAFVSLCYRKR